MLNDRTHRLAHGPALRGVDLIVLHATAGYTADTAVQAMERRNVSAHVVVERDGSLVTCVPDTHRAWHAGGSLWGGRGDVNSRSLGVEIVNFGYVEPIGRWAAIEARFDPERHGIVEIGIDPDGYAGRREQSRAVVTRQAPIVAGPAPHDMVGGPAYPGVQVERVVEVVARWCNTKRVGVEHVVGHCHVQPRKEDPYPWFPWSDLRAMLRERVIYRSPCRDIVKALQSHLDRLGCRPGSVDGVPGPMTRRAWLEARQRYLDDSLDLDFDNPPAEHVRIEFGRACDLLVEVYPPVEVRR